MSRHKNLKGIIADSYYDEDVYGEESKPIYDDDYGDEQPVAAKKKKSKPKKVANQVDEKVVKEIYEGF